jgi:U3 small nucleolar RNA-associated protein 22
VKPVAATDEGKAKVVLDKKAVFREIERVGKGLVVKIEENGR